MGAFNPVVGESTIHLNIFFDRDENIIAFKIALIFSTEFTTISHVFNPILRHKI